MGNTCVAEFQRLAVDSKGGDAKARIYEVDGDFVVSFYTGTDCVGTGTPCVTYASALNAAIEWIDNSEFFS